MQTEQGQLDWQSAFPWLASSLCKTRELSVKAVDFQMGSARWKSHLRAIKGTSQQAAQSLPKPGALKILDWGQDVLTRMEWGDCDLTKKTMPRPAEASQKTASPSGAHTACVFPPSCPVRGDLSGTGYPQGQTLHSYMPLGSSSRLGRCRLASV